MERRLPHFLHDGAITRFEFSKEEFTAFVDLEGIKYKLLIENPVFVSMISMPLIMIVSDLIIHRIINLDDAKAIDIPAAILEEFEQSHLVEMNQAIQKGREVNIVQLIGVAGIQAFIGGGAVEITQIGEYEVIPVEPTPEQQRVIDAFKNAGRDAFFTDGQIDRAKINEVAMKVLNQKGE